VTVRFLLWNLADSKTTLDADVLRRIKELSAKLPTPGVPDE